MTLMKQSDYAKHRGVSEARVSQWKSLKSVVIDPKTRLVDVEASDAIIDAKPLEDKGGKRRQPPGQRKRGKSEDAAVAERLIERGEVELLTHADAVAKKENYLALLRQLEYDRESGAVIAIEDAVKEYVARISRVRTKLLAIPSKVAGRIALLRSPEEVQAFLDEEFALVLTELSGDADGLTRLGKIPKRAK